MKRKQKSVQKKVRAAREKVADNLAEKAANLNPLTETKPVVMTDKDVPQITNETIAEHREEVLKGARKFIYPLAHSKLRIVVVALVIITSSLIGLLVYCGLGLYRYYQYNAFLYRSTQVVPFPIARFGGTFVDYENYLFELRHYVHYYQTQQQDLFGGDKQIQAYRKQVLNNVINNAYIKKLAAMHNVRVSDAEVDQRIDIVRNQNRLGSNNKVFADVLHDYWGWSINDFKRSLKDEILAEKVAAAMDTAAQSRAQAALGQAKSGADFGALAKSVSQDPTAKDNGGDYGFSISQTNPNVPPQVVDTLFKLQPGQISGVIVANPVQAGAPATLEIVKVVQKNGDSVTAQHINFNLTDITTYINQLKAKQPPHLYVKF
jgi:hypothetical protein